MHTAAHLALLIGSFVCLAMSWYLAPQPDPVWKRLVSIGLALFVASFISW